MNEGNNMNGGHGTWFERWAMLAILFAYIAFIGVKVDKLNEDLRMALKVSSAERGNIRADIARLAAKLSDPNETLKQVRELKNLLSTPAREIWHSEQHAPEHAWGAIITPTAPKGRMRAGQ